jgi:hypothetical protein
MRIVFTAILLIGVVVSHAQQELHIHQINIENGDATMIGVYDTSAKKYTSRILIDGGQLTPDQMLLPYLRKMIGSDAASLHFQYVILTHYHNDHYNGLLALQDGSITADSIIDPGGYRVNSYFKHTAVAGTSPQSMSKAVPWLTAMKEAARHTPAPFVKGRSKVMLRYGTDNKTSIGNSIVIGKIGSNNVELRCIAGWGNTLSENGTIVGNPKPSKTSANNFTLAFILSCGEFRYFIGGDMGGRTGSYIDQESSVTKFLNNEYPSAESITDGTSVKGHLCGFKANHHGSSESNIETFMESMHPAIVMTSAGSNSGWHLPSVEYLERLADVQPVSESSLLPAGSFNKGVYFTNLYNFPAGDSRTRAISLFRNKPGVSFHFGNETPAGKRSYLVKITDAGTLNSTSKFEVGTVDLTKTSPYEKLADFTCHKN